MKQGKHNLAVESFEKAKELDPTNEEYDQRIQDAKSKIKPTTQQQQQAPANPFAAMGGMPNFGSGGMPNVFEMMNNPEFMNMAQNMMVWLQVVIIICSKIHNSKTLPRTWCKTLVDLMAHNSQILKNWPTYQYDFTTWN